MKNVLIYLQEGMLAKTGGQLGYNYVLKTQLDQRTDHSIHFLPGGKPFVPGLGRKIKNTWYGKILKTVNDFKIYTKFLYKKRKPLVNLNDYDLIHFHTSYEMYALRDELKDYKGKVIITSHTPQVSYTEMEGMLTEWSQRHMKWYYDKLERMDTYAFKRADYIFFPCPEAEEPYYHTWDKYEQIKKEKSQCYRYIATGTYKCEAKVSRPEILRKYKIPEDAFVICYAGRHNEIKGYDLLKSIGEQILENNKNVYFLIAGEESPIKGLSHPHWIEIGWTKDPHSLISASDVFILPNRETYFDLIMLEVLSLGKIVVASNTGGNKHFVRDETDGIFIYNDLDNAVSTVNKLISMSVNERKEMEKHNLSLFNTKYSAEVFADNYIKLVNCL